jgi:hypothetical protein
MAENPNVFTVFEEIKVLLADYLLANPDAENPYEYIFVLGPDDLLALLQKANKREIVFTYLDGDPDKFEIDIIEKKVE